MGQSLNGFYLEVKVPGSPEDWSEIGEITEMNLPGFTVPAIEDTNSKDTVRKYIPSKLEEVGDLTLSIRFNPAKPENLHWMETNGLRKIQKNKEVREWRTNSGTLSGSPGSVGLQLYGFVTQYDTGPLVNGEGWTAEVTIKPTAGVTEI